MSTKVKICGVTNEADAEHVVAAGADYIGLNFVSASKRCISVAQAQRIVRVVRGRVPLVGVVADLSFDQLMVLRSEAGVDRLQLHGHEPPELLERLPAQDYKAVHIADAADVESAYRYRGPRLLVDAKVSGALGGTGQRFDWRLLGELVERRELMLAGGLTPDNVSQAVREVRPFAVDVASGVELQAGRKDPELVRRFIEQVRSALS